MCICACCTDGLLIIKLKQCSRLLHARCALRSRGINACETFCPAPRGCYESHHHRLWRGECAFCRARSRQDRKSTRLNSSHVSISYAVFCLKKKKKKKKRNNDVKDDII